MYRMLVGGLGTEPLTIQRINGRISNINPQFSTCILSPL